MSFHYMHLNIVFSTLSVVVVTILLIAESKSLYRRIYGHKETSSSGSKETDIGRVERIQSGSVSDEAASQGSSTSIDIPKPSRSTSAKPEPSYNKPLSRTHLRLHILPLLMYSFYVMTGIVSILFRLGIGSFSECKPCGIKGSLFAAGKSMMYLIFIYRLHAIYSNTAFQYSTKYLSIMAVICVLYQCILCVASVMTVKSLSVQIGGETYCGCEYKMLVPGAIFLADTIVSIVCCCAFIKPLKALQDFSTEARDEELHRSVVKNMTLTCVAVITTIVIMLAIIVSKLNGLAALDIIINSICIFLMHKERDLWFKYLCFDGKCARTRVLL